MFWGEIHSKIQLDNTEPSAPDTNSKHLTVHFDTYTFDCDSRGFEIFDHGMEECFLKIPTSQMNSC